MRNRKFIICLLLMVLLSFSFISCGKQASSATTVLVTTTTREITTTSVISDSSVKYGLTETQRKQAFYDLSVLQDSIALEDPPDRSEQMLEAYSTIAKKYSITTEEMMEIVGEGMEKNWPMPPV